jgi:hypothetical protein
VRRATWALGAAVMWACAGCETGAGGRREDGAVSARFYLESTRDGAGNATLPRSDVTISILPKPVITEFDVVSVEIAEVELGRCLKFQLTPAASRDLYRLTASRLGRRLVLFLNGQAVGARRIDEPIEDGALLIFVERPDEALPALVENLHARLAILQEAQK